MEQGSSNTKKIAVSTIIFLLVVFALWFFFFRNTTTAEQAFDDFGNPIETEVVGEDLINTLAELQNVTLDSSIFKTAGFLNLTDFAVDLPSQPIGRSNPFESIRGGGKTTSPSR